MGHYRATQSYRASRQIGGGVDTIGLTAGDTVEFDADTAAWIEADSPGTLEAIDGPDDESPTPEPDDESPTPEPDDESPTPEPEPKAPRKAPRHKN